MRRRAIRRAHLVVIALALAFAMFGVWYRAFVSRDGLLAQGGVMGLTVFLLAQLLLDAEEDLAHAVLSARVDRLEACVRRVAEAAGVDADECEDISEWGA